MASKERLICPVTGDEVRVIMMRTGADNPRSCLLVCRRYWKSRIFSNRAAAVRWLSEEASFKEEDIEVVEVPHLAAGHDTVSYTVRSKTGWSGDFIQRTPNNALYRILTPGMRPPDDADVQVLGITSVVDEFQMEKQEGIGIDPNDRDQIADLLNEAERGAASAD